MSKEEFVRTIKVESRLKHDDCEILVGLLLKYGGTTSNGVKIFKMHGAQGLFQYIEFLKILGG